MHTTSLTDLRRDALFHPRGALGRRRAASFFFLFRTGGMKRGLSGVLRGRARQASFFHAFI